LKEVWLKRRERKRFHTVQIINYLLLKICHLWFDLISAIGGKGLEIAYRQNLQLISSERKKLISAKKPEKALSQAFDILCIN
jgi:hypothetical protein